MISGLCEVVLDVRVTLPVSKDVIFAHACLAHEPACWLEFVDWVCFVLFQTSSAT